MSALSVLASERRELAGLAGSGCELDTQVCARHTVAIQSLLQRHILISHQYYGMRVCLALPLPALARSRYSQQSLFLHARSKRRKRERDAARDACLPRPDTHYSARSHLSQPPVHCLSFLCFLRRAMPILDRGAAAQSPNPFFSAVVAIASTSIAEKLQINVAKNMLYKFVSFDFLRQ